MTRTEYLDLITDRLNELRDEMIALRGNLDALYDEEDDTSAASDLVHIDLPLKDALKLVDDSLTFARMAARSAAVRAAKEAA